MNDFKKALEEIKQRESSLLDIVVSDNGHVSGSDMEYIDSFGPVVSFLIYANYCNVFDFTKINDDIDIPILLSQSSHYNVNKLLPLWNEIANNYPYTLELINILSQYNLAKYKSKENDEIISDFIVANFLFRNQVVWYNGNNHLIAFEIIDSCSFQLGIEMKESDTILISVADVELLKLILNKLKYRKLVFSGCGRFDLFIRVAIGFLDFYKECQYVVKEENKFFPFDNAQFDSLYYFSNEKTPLSLNNLMQYIKKDGFCIAFNQSREKACDAFYDCEIPLVLDIVNNLVILAKNKMDETERVRYGFCNVNNDTVSESEYWKNLLVSVIKTNGYNDYFQILSKDDFRYASNKIDFHSVCREKDQLLFIWRDLNDIITKLDDEELIYNSDAEITKVVDIGDMSYNPFQIKADSSKYTNYFENIPTNEKHIVEKFELGRIDDHSYNFIVPQEYVDIFNKTFLERNDSCERSQNLIKTLCYRLVTKPALLWGQFGVLRVEASKVRPVCIVKCCFSCEDPIGYSWDCTDNVDTIKIAQEYDENFVIYQLINANKHRGHILVAPTKEEQRTFFLNKRLEYLSTYQPIVDEMEDEIKHAVAISDSRISGVGLKNFRRFSNLELLPLSGVNILVGGNNSGKSTFVKGLLLGFDNIKSLTPQTIRYKDDNRILYFQLDANNIHDVHVGTFNRAYSAQPFPIDEELYRKMSFEIHVANYVIETVISPNGNDDLTSIPIVKLCVIDEKRNATFIFDYIKDTTTLSYEIDSVNHTKTFRMLRLYKYNDKTNIIASQIRCIADYISSHSECDFDEDWNVLQSLKGRTGFMIEISSELDGILSNTQVEYIYAHGIHQRILFNYNDRNDYMAITLHDLMNENISKDEELFIKNWMVKFGIGNNYEISSIGGEAYSIQIKNMNNVIVYLADMGMGASQLMVLIFRLAIIIHRQRMKGNTPYKPTIIIEEPEQNMHPAYQSKLAELFYEVYKKYGFNFIVETHSEYLVRKSQVIVSQQKYRSQDTLNKNNPFKVYYFPSDGNPYEMEYRSDGNFGNDFGTGFYDEANNLLFEII